MKNSKNSNLCIDTLYHWADATTAIVDSTFIQVIAEESITTKSKIDYSKVITRQPWNRKTTRE